MDSDKRLIVDPQEIQKIIEEAKDIVDENIPAERRQDKLESLKVAADPADIQDDERKKRVKKLAGAISHALRTEGEVSVRAFGNAAIAKAAKALAIAKEYIATTDKLQLIYSPAFITTQIGDNTLTGISFFSFAEEGDQKKDYSLVKKVLMVKADVKDIGNEDRRLAVRKLAGAIAHAVEENGECLVRCFGHSSIGKGAKALAIARGFTATRGPDLYCWNDFIVTKMSEDKERTGIAYYCFSNK